MHPVPRRDAFSLMATIKSRNLISTILWAGFLVGLLDISAACINYYIRTGKNPVVVFQYIASSLFGKEAYSGDDLMILMGGLFHFMIAYIFTILFFILYPRISFMRINVILTGFLYGLFIWVIMNLLVLPTTKVSLPASFDIKQSLIGMVILVLAIGIPLSCIARRYYARQGLKNSA
jgi:hypothetical protein